MASPQHATLVAATVTTLTFTENANSARVVNVDGVAPIYVTTNGVTPVVAASGTYVVTAGVGAYADVPFAPASGSRTVKLISASTPAVSVEVR